MQTKWGQISLKLVVCFICRKEGLQADGSWQEPELRDVVCECPGSQNVLWQKMTIIIMISCIAQIMALQIMIPG